MSRFGFGAYKLASLLRRSSNRNSPQWIAHMIENMGYGESRTHSLFADWDDEGFRIFSRHILLLYTGIYAKDGDYNPERYMKKIDALIIRLIVERHAILSAAYPYLPDDIALQWAVVSLYTHYPQEPLSPLDDQLFPTMMRNKLPWQVIDNIALAYLEVQFELEIPDA